MSKPGANPLYQPLSVLENASPQARPVMSSNVTPGYTPLHNNQQKQLSQFEFTKSPQGNTPIAEQNKYYDEKFLMGSSLGKYDFAEELHKSWATAVASNQSNQFNQLSKDPYGDIQKPDSIPGTVEYKEKLVNHTSCFLTTDMICCVLCILCSIYLISEDWWWIVICACVSICLLWAFFCYFTIKNTNMSLPTSNAVLHKYFFYRLIIAAVVLASAVFMITDSFQASSKIQKNVGPRDADRKNLNDQYTTRSTYTAVFGSIYLFFGIFIIATEYNYWEAVDYWKNNFVFADQGNPYSAS